MQNPQNNYKSKSNIGQISTYQILFGGFVLILWCGVFVSGIFVFWQSLSFNINHSRMIEPTLNQSLDDGNGYIKTKSDFENSSFCHKYDCQFASQIEIANDLDNLYLIGRYPVYNEFLIEIITSNEIISEFAITLDPREISSDDLMFIEDFLFTIFSNGADNRDIQFIHNNLGNHVSQICQANSISLGSKQIWVGSVGLAPSILIAEICKK